MCRFWDTPISFRKLRCCQAAATKARVPNAMRVSPRLRVACGRWCFPQRFLRQVLEELANGEAESDH